MPRMMIEVPEAVKEQIAFEVAEGGYGDAGAYVARFVREERKRRTRAHVEAMVEEAFQSGDATPMTEADWDQRRQNLRNRLRIENSKATKAQLEAE